jgi:hypothetical protein
MRLKGTTASAVRQNGRFPADGARVIWIHSNNVLYTIGFIRFGMAKSSKRFIPTTRQRVRSLIVLSALPFGDESGFKVRYLKQLPAGNELTVRPVRA